MKKAKLADKDLVLDILTESFDANKSVNYVVKQDSKRKNRVRGLMEYSFNQCFHFGDVWLSDDNKACALVLYEDQKKSSLKTIGWDAKLALNVIGISRVFRVLSRESKIKKIHPKSKFTYLWFIGVYPDHQGKSIGSKLLRGIIEKAEKEGKPIYLETSMKRNVAWYHSNGFETYQELEVGHNLFMLKRNAGILVS